MRDLSRQDIIALVALAAVALLIPAVVVSRHFFGIDPVSMLKINWGRTVAGILFTVLATGVCLLNFYLATFVPWRYKQQHGSMEGYGHVSGLPVIGGFFILCAGALMPPSISLGVFLLLLYLIDSHGLPRIFLAINPG